MRFYIFLAYIVFFTSCENNSDTTKINKKTNQYEINGEVKNRDNNWIYLSIINKNQFHILDSTQIINGKFRFTGKLEAPKKASLHMKKYDGFFVFILANETIKIELSNNINKSLVYNSSTNDELQRVTKESEQIFKKIDYLFPLLQKARMENDAEKLELINNKIKAIIKENNKYITQYIIKHPNSYVSGILLNDLWNNPEKDSVYLIELAKKLPKNIQNNLDFVIQ